MGRSLKYNTNEEKNKARKLSRRKKHDESLQNNVLTALLNNRDQELDKRGQSEGLQINQVDDMNKSVTDEVMDGICISVVNFLITEIEKDEVLEKVVSEKSHSSVYDSNSVYTVSSSSKFVSTMETLVTNGSLNTKDSDNQSLAESDLIISDGSEKSENVFSASSPKAHDYCLRKRKAVIPITEQIGYIRKYKKLDSEDFLKSAIMDTEKEDEIKNIIREEIDEQNRFLYTYCFSKRFLKGSLHYSLYNLLYRKKQLCRYALHRLKNDDVTNDCKVYDQIKIWRTLYYNMVNLEDPYSVENKFEDSDKSTVSSQYNFFNNDDDYDDEFPKNGVKEGSLVENEMLQGGLIRFCDEKCPKLEMENIRCLDQVLRDLLIAIYNRRYQLVNDTLMTKFNLLNNETISSFLYQYYNCFVGFRTIYNRISQLRHCIIYVRGKDAEQIVIKELPNFLKLKIFIKSNREKTGLAESQILLKYLNYIKMFREKEEDVETVVCMICKLLWRKSKIEFMNRAHFDSFEMSHLLSTEFLQEKKIQVCKCCKKSINKGIVPENAYLSGYDRGIIPEYFKNLNFVEQNLIQMVHCIVGTYCVENKEGKRTEMRGKYGALTIHTVPIDSNINTICQTYPMLHGVEVIVESDNFKDIVINLETVLMCLKYLKENSPPYKDIAINYNFKFDENNKILVEKNQIRNSENVKSNKIVSIDDSLISLVLTTPGPNSYINLGHGDKAPTAQDRFRMKLHNYSPESIDGRDYDLKMFPWLFPNGRGGWDSIKSNWKKIIKNHLRSCDRTIARDSTFLICVTGIKEQKELHSLIATTLRKAKSSFKKREVNKLKSSKLLSEQVLFASILKGLRGFAPYWDCVKERLRSVVQVLGWPCWFMTFNPDIKRWKMLHKAYGDVYPGQVIDKTNIFTYVAKDPTIFQRFFRSRFKEMMNFIKSDAEPLGEVIHSFERFELQEGGLLHVHCFLWVNGSPDIDTCDEDVCKFIDRYITCRKPNEGNEPYLFDIVNNCQRHNVPCSNTCAMVMERNGKKKIEYCRFNFPRHVCGKTCLRSAFGSYFDKYTQRTYMLARSEEEIHINDYSPAIAYVWNANHDIQYIANCPSTLINYTTNYLTKQKGLADLLYTRNKHKVVQTKALFKVGVDLFQRTKRPLTECIDYLMGHDLFKFSLGHVFINVEEDDKRTRIILPFSVLNQLCDNDRAFAENLIDDYYPRRPKELEFCCLFNFAISFAAEFYEKPKDGNKVDYTKYAKNPRGKISEYEDFIDYNGNDFTVSKLECRGRTFGRSRYHPFLKKSPFFNHHNLRDKMRMKLLNSEGKEIVKLTQQLCPQVFLPVFKPGDAKTREDYYRRVCMLFIPWRDENYLRSFFVRFQTYENTWTKYRRQLETECPNAVKDIDAFLKTYNDLYNDEIEMFNKRKKPEFSKWTDEPVSKLNPFNFDRKCPRDKEIIEKEIDALERPVDLMAEPDKFCKQYTIFKEIVQFIGEKIENPKLCSKTWFISGKAGTGKSFLLKVLDRFLTFLYSPAFQTQIDTPSVIICAPTGSAAHHVKGFTIHKLFNIIPDVFRPLSENDRDLLRIHFNNVCLLIIDEISMCSNFLLMCVNYRLQEITGCSEFFGGINVLFIGDLLQLCPTKSEWCFESYKRRGCEQWAFTFDEYNLWSFLDIEYFELCDNQRQKTDVDFGIVLDRIRVGHCTDKDIEFLDKRVIERKNNMDDMELALQTYKLLLEEHDNVVALFSRNEYVNSFNFEYVKKNFQVKDLVKITPKKAVSKKLNKRYNFVKVCYKKKKRPWQYSCNNLNNVNMTDNKKKKQSKLQSIAKGIRVMLTRNINLTKGLVNGALGTVVDFGVNKVGIVENIMIKFDKLSIPYKLHRGLITFKKSFRTSVQMKEFPLIVAFACTIHKSQSQTFDAAIISLKDVSQPGQAYVALSRLKTSEGLYLIEKPNKEQFQCDVAALNEYNKLRKTRNLPEVKINGNVDFLNDYRHVSADSRNKIYEQGEISVYKRNINLCTKNVDIDSNKNGFLILKNKTNDCACIAVIQLLNIADVYRNSIISSFESICEGEKNGVHDCIVNIFSKTNDDCILLRNAMHKYCDGFPVEGFANPGNVLDILQKQFTSEENKIVSFLFSKYKSCLCDMDNLMIEKKERSMLQITVVNVNDYVTFDSMLKKYLCLPDDGICKVCNCEQTWIRKIEIPESQKYLFMEFYCYKNKKEFVDFIGNSSIDNFREGKVLFKVRWRLIGAVQFLKKKEHYLTWIRYRRNGKYNSGWIVLDDDKIPKYEKTFLNNLKNVKLLLFERYDENYESDSEESVCSLVSDKRFKKRTFNEFEDVTLEAFENIDFDKLASIDLNNDDSDHVKRRRLSNLLLSNTGTDCFLISAVQLMYCAKEYRESIIRNVNVNTIQKLLCDIFLFRERTVEKLRATLSTIFPTIPVSAEGDAAQALFCIRQNVDEISNSLLQFTYRKKETCSCSDFSNVSQVDFVSRYLMSSLEISMDLQCNKNSFQSMINRWLKGNTKKKCKKCNQNIFRHRQFVSGDFQKYLFVDLSVRGDDNTAFFIDAGNVGSLTTTFFNIKWKLLGAIEFIFSPNVKHYKIWNREASFDSDSNFRWRIIDTNDDVTIKEEFSKDLGIFKSLLFERVLDDTVARKEILELKNLGHDDYLIAVLEFISNAQEFVILFLSNVIEREKRNPLEYDLFRIFTGQVKNVRMLRHHMLYLPVSISCKNAPQGNVLHAINELFSSCFSKEVLGMMEFSLKIFKSCKCTNNKLNFYETQIVFIYNISPMNLKSRLKTFDQFLHYSQNVEKTCQFCFEQMIMKRIPVIEVQQKYLIISLNSWIPVFCDSGVRMERNCVDASAINFDKFEFGKAYWKLISLVEQLGEFDHDRIYRTWSRRNLNNDSWICGDKVKAFNVNDVSAFSLFLFERVQESKKSDGYRNNDNQDVYSEISSIKMLLKSMHHFHFDLNNFGLKENVQDLDSLFQKLNINNVAALDVFRFNLSEFKLCDCNNGKSLFVKEHDRLMLTLNVDSKINDNDIATMMYNATHFINECNVCMKEDGAFFKLSPRTNSANKYLIIGINTWILDMDSNQYKQLFVDASKLDIENFSFDKYWILIGGIEGMGRCKYSQIFSSWHRRNDNSWLKVTGNKEEIYNEFPKNWQCICYVIFEKIDNPNFFGYCKNPEIKISCSEVKQFVKSKNVTSNDLDLDCVSINEQRAVDEYLSIQNMGNDCFLISALNLIYSCQDLASEIVNYDNCNNDVFKLIRDIFLKKIKHVRFLRKTNVNFMEKDVNGVLRQEDAGQALSFVFENLPSSIRNLILFNKNEILKCGCGEKQSVLKNEQLLPLHALSLKKNTIEEMVQREVYSERVCNNCKKTQTRVINPKVPITQKYLFVQINSWTYYTDENLTDEELKVNQPKFVQCKIEGFDINKFYFGVQWKMIGMIEHIGDYGGGHYKTWKREINDSWIVLDDDRISFKNVLPKNFSSFVYIVFCRVV